MIVEVPNCRWWVEIDENQYPYCPCNIYIDDYLVDEIAFDFDTHKFDCIEEDSRLRSQDGFEKYTKILEKEIMRVWECEY